MRKKGICLMIAISIISLGYAQSIKKDHTIEPAKMDLNTNNRLRPTDMETH